jgi:glycosyltransferase involved in cell wall biosynthesis
MHQVVDPSAVDGDFTRMHRVRVPSRVARLGLGGVQSIVRSCADAVIVHEPTLAAPIEGATVIPHGIEWVRPISRRDAREALGLGDDFTALCFGFLAPYKGLEVALAAVARTDTEMRLVIAGGDHPRLAGRDRYADHLRSAANERVRFTGHVPEADVPFWFGAADVALLPYPKPFSSSGALALALAHRTPSLLSLELARCVGAPAVMGVDCTGRDGCTDHTDCTEAAAQILADRLDELATQPAALDELGAATASVARDRSWPLVAARHLDLYEEVIREHRPSRRRVRTAQPG